MKIESFAFDFHGAVEFVRKISHATARHAVHFPLSAARAINRFALSFNRERRVKVE